MTGYHWPGFDSSEKLPSNWRMLVSPLTVKLIQGENCPPASSQSPVSSCSCTFTVCTYRQKPLIQLYIKVVKAQHTLERCQLLTLTWVLCSKIALIIPATYSCWTKSFFCLSSFAGWPLSAQSTIHYISHAHMCYRPAEMDLDEE